MKKESKKEQRVREVREARRAAFCKGAMKSGRGDRPDIGAEARAIFDAKKEHYKARHESALSVKGFYKRMFRRAYEDHPVTLLAASYVVFTAVIALVYWVVQL